jgi:hypothetical protein
VVHDSNLLMKTHNLLCQNRNGIFKSLDFKHARNVHGRINNIATDPVSNKFGSKI